MFVLFPFQISAIVLTVVLSSSMTSSSPWTSTPTRPESRRNWPASRYAALHCLHRPQLTPHSMTSRLRSQCGRVFWQTSASAFCRVSPCPTRSFTQLTIFSVYAAISSLSLSLLATGIDSVFDIGSNVLLFWLHKKADALDANKWPVGGSRLETIGNIVYGEPLSAHHGLRHWLTTASRIPVG